MQRQKAIIVGTWRWDCIAGECHEGTLRDDVFVQCLDCGDGVTGVYIYQNSSNCTHSVCAVYCMSVIPQ